ncbi:MAG: DUF6702 family protein [Gemmatimonadota bacterium]
MRLGDPTPSHPIHVTYGRLQIEPTGVTLRIRMFKDDLEKALVQDRRPKAVSPSAPEMDSNFSAYCGERIVLVADGMPLKGTVSGRGTEQDMRWYSIRFPTSKPVHTLALSNRMFFELFTDQQNLLKVVDTASGEESSLYFVLGEPGPVTLTFNR